MAPKRRADGPPPSAAHAASASGSFSKAGSSAAAAKRLRFATNAAPIGERSGTDSIAYAAAKATVPTIGGADAGADDDEEDHVGDIELEEQDRKRTQQGRKGRVVTEMSDSESEDEDAEGPGRAAVDDEDEDMFAPEAADTGKDKSSKAADDQRFLKLSDIEGQEFGKRTRAPDAERADLEADAPGSDEEEDADPDFELESSEDGDQEDEAEGAGKIEDDAMEDGAAEAEGEAEGDDALAGADESTDGATKRSKKKLKKGMGYKIESFNMKAEIAAGRFDEEGNYVENAKDPHAEHDNWLQGNYNRKAIKAAREAAKKRDKEARTKALQEQEAALSVTELQKRSAELIQKGESVLEALQRIGKEAKKHQPEGVKKKSWKSAAGKGKQKADQMDIGEGAEGSIHSSLKALEDLTAYSSALMSEHGMINIYDETYEALLRSVRRSGQVPSDWDPAGYREKEALDSRDPAMGSTGTGASEAVETSQENGKAKEGEPTYLYRWSPSYLAETATSSGQPVNPEIETFGPYPLSDLKDWSQQGYFGPSNERILLRRVDAVSGATPWQQWSEVMTM